jgi:hypothetical protein
MTISGCFISPLFFNEKILVGITEKTKNRIFAKKKLFLSLNMNNQKNKEEKLKLETEKVLFEGSPSKLELVIPFLSILTVIGIIPFIATLLRQFWVQYKITNRRISVLSGFGGKDRVEIVYRDIKEINHITRFGGQIADVVIILKDDAQLELRSLPDWEKNLGFIKENMELGQKKNL